MTSIESTGSAATLFDASWIFGATFSFRVGLGATGSGFALTCSIAGTGFRTGTVSERSFARTDEDLRWEGGGVDSEAFCFSGVGCVSEGSSYSTWMVWRNPPFRFESGEFLTGAMVGTTPPSFFS